MPDDIYKVNSNLPTTTKIELVNDQTLALNGKVEGARFDKVELDELYTSTGIPRQFLRRQGLGNTSATYAGWTHVKTEDGYSIWTFSPTAYEYNALNQMYYDGKLVANKGLAGAVSAEAFEYVLLDTSGVFTDNTTEANSEGGTPFTMMSYITDYVYFGSDAIFSGIKLEWNDRGSYYANVIEYYTGESGGDNGWFEITADDFDLVDGTSHFQGDGNITWDETAVADWITTAIDSKTHYWIRISTIQTPTTPAQCYYATPANTVVGLLALSTNDILSEEWAFCSYAGAVYVTVRNTGNSLYEGTYYIESSSTSANKKNFFVYNHQFTADYADSGYDPEFPEYADNAAATASGTGMDIGMFYRTDDVVKVVHA